MSVARIVQGVLVLAFCSAFAGEVYAQCIVNETDKIQASVKVALDGFGSAVAIDGDWAAIGTPGVDDFGFSSGAAYVFRFDGTNWVELLKLVAADSTGGDEFGASVAIVDDLIFVGAPNDDDACSGNANCNSVSGYIFQRDFGGVNHWGELTKIAASDAALNDQFGSSLSARGDLLVAGALNEGNTSGATDAPERPIFSK